MSHKIIIDADPGIDDSLAILFALQSPELDIDPTLFRLERAPIFVETEGRCAGQTVADRRKERVNLPEVDVCVDVDSARLLALFKERFTG